MESGWLKVEEGKWKVEEEKTRARVKVRRGLEGAVVLNAEGGGTFVGVVAGKRTKKERGKGTDPRVHIGVSDAKISRPLPRQWLQLCRSRAYCSAMKLQNYRVAVPKTSIRVDVSREEEAGGCRRRDTRRDAVSTVVDRSADENQSTTIA